MKLLLLLLIITSDGNIVTNKSEIKASDKIIEMVEGICKACIEPLNDDMDDFLDMDLTGIEEMTFIEE